MIEGLGPWDGGFEHIAERGKWRVTVWVKGKALVHKDFVFESLAYGWAEKRRKEYAALKATGVFVKKEKVE